ncbi:hypothetical protein P3W45_001520 [Vairimorpha bombi]|jgi:hypothetical protein
MKYLEISQILKTNKIIKKIEETHSSLAIDLEVFSCKSSKKQKMYKNHPKPIRYLLETMQLTFPDYSFVEEDLGNFIRLTYQDVVNEIMYTFMIFYKSKDEVSEFVEFLGIIIDKTVHLDGCEIFAYKNRKGPFEKFSWYFCFFFYSKDEKRVLMLNIRCV